MVDLIHLNSLELLMVSASGVKVSSDVAICEILSSSRYFGPMKMRKTYAFTSKCRYIRLNNLAKTSLFLVFFFFWNGRRLTGLRKCGWYVTEKFGLLRCQRGSTEAAIVSPRFKLEKVGIDISVSTPWADRFQG